MANRSTALPHTRFLLGFSLVLLLALAGFWYHYQQNGWPGIRFPFLPSVEEPNWTTLQTLRGQEVNGESFILGHTDRPVMVMVWVDTESTSAWEQWKHLASVADHPRMDLVQLVILAKDGLEEIKAHAQQMGLPAAADYRFVHVSPSALERVFSEATLRSDASTWVYLHEEPVFAVQGRLVPPREWLNLLEW